MQSVQSILAMSFPLIVPPADGGVPDGGFSEVLGEEVSGGPEAPVAEGAGVPMEMVGWVGVLAVSMVPDGVAGSADEGLMEPPVVAGSSLADLSAEGSDGEAVVAGPLVVANLPDVAPDVSLSTPEFAGGHAMEAVLEDNGERLPFVAASPLSLIGKADVLGGPPGGVMRGSGAARAAGGGGELVGDGGVGSGTMEGDHVRSMHLEARVGESGGEASSFPDTRGTETQGREAARDVLALFSTASASKAAVVAGQAPVDAPVGSALPEAHWSPRITSRPGLDTSAVPVLQDPRPKDSQQWATGMGVRETVQLVDPEEMLDGPTSSGETEEPVSTPSTPHGLDTSTRAMVSGPWERVIAGLLTPVRPQAAVGVSLSSSYEPIAAAAEAPRTLEGDEALVLSREPTMQRPTAPLPDLREDARKIGPLDIPAPDAVRPEEMLNDKPDEALPIGFPAPGPTVSAATPGTAPAVTGVPVPHIAAQIGAALSRAGDGSTELALSPEELGRVRLKLKPDVAHPDRMVVMITFERPETLELFRRHAGELADALRASGYAGADIGFGQEGGFASGSGRHEKDAGYRDDAPLRAEAASSLHTPSARLVARASLDLRL